MSDWGKVPEEAERVDVEVMPCGELTGYCPELWMNISGMSASGMDQLDALVGVIGLPNRHGDPLYFGPDKNGNIVLKRVNQGFFAGLCALSLGLVHDPDDGGFHRYDAVTGLYIPVTRDALKQVVSGQLLKASQASDALYLLAEMRNDRMLNEIVSQLRGVAEAKGVFAGRVKLIHLANCVLRLTGGTFVREAFSPNHYSRRRSPISYDPTATCPRFLGELLGAALDVDDLLLLQKMSGQFLLGDNLIQRLLSIFGEGGHGKTTLADVIQGVVGEDLVGQLRTKQLGERFEIGRYSGYSLLIGVDVGPNFLTGESAEAVKGLIGGDRFVCESKNSNSRIPVRGDFNLLVCSNPLLKVAVNGDVSAWRRRLLCIEFGGEKPVKKIPKFAQLLIAEEGPGILNWMLEGLRMLSVDIEELGDVRMTPAQLARVDAMVGYSDSIRLFLAERVGLCGGSDIAAAELVDAYQRFCGERGWSSMTNVQVVRQLPDLMSAMGASRRHDIIRNGGMVRGYGGVGWLEAEKQCPGGSR